MSALAASRLIASAPSGDFKSSTRLFLPAFSWPNVVEQPLRTGGRVRIVSPSSVSILMTSAPMSASMREQWGPAIVVEKSSTRRPAKHPVKVPSSFSDSVIAESSSPYAPTAADWCAGPDIRNILQRTLYECQGQGALAKL